MKWVCLCRVHIFEKDINEILFGNDNEEKKTSDFLIFADENLGDFFLMDQLFWFCLNNNCLW